MSAVEPLCQMIGINPKELSREELFVLEARLFTMLCDELRRHFKSQHKEYFFSTKSSQEMENFMETNFVSLVIRDIVATGEYTEAGSALYTQVPTDVIDDIVTGRNPSPSVSLFEKIINLHRSVRKELYREIMEIIAEKFFRKNELEKNTSGSKKGQTKKLSP